MQLPIRHLICPQTLIGPHWFQLNNCQWHFHYWHLDCFTINTWCTCAVKCGSIFDSTKNDLSAKLLFPCTQLWLDSSYNKCGIVAKLRLIFAEIETMKMEQMEYWWYSVEYKKNLRCLEFLIGLRVTSLCLLLN